MAFCHSQNCGLGIEHMYERVVSVNNLLKSLLVLGFWGDSFDICRICYPVGAPSKCYFIFPIGAVPVAPAPKMFWHVFKDAFYRSNF